MFKIGDKVHCNDHNKDGIITSISSKLHTLYPISVGFNDGSFEYYMYNGQIVPSEPSIVLNVIDEMSAGDTHVGG